MNGNGMKCRIGNRLCFLLPGNENAILKNKAFGQGGGDFIGDFWGQMLLPSDLFTTCGNCGFLDNGNYIAACAACHYIMQEA